MGQGVSLPRPLVLAPLVPLPIISYVPPLVAPSMPPPGAHLFWTLPPVKHVRESEPVPEESDEEEDPEEDHEEKDPEEDSKEDDPEEEDSTVVLHKPYAEEGGSSMDATLREQLDCLLREANEYLETGKIPGPSYASDDDYSGV